LQSAANYIGRNSDVIFALDRFMKSHLLDNGIEEDKIKVVPVWPPMSKLYEGSRMDNPFRIEHGFGDRIVIMYSGNHAIMHPLDTLLESALRLKDHPQFLFVFIGGGVRVSDVTDFKAKHQLDNIVQLPFQPREMIHLSLGSADIQVVILGEGQVGYTHPNKIYGAIFIGKPVLYIGPKESHVSDITDNIPGNIVVGNDQVDELVDKIIAFGEYSIEQQEVIGKGNLAYARQHFYPEKLKQQMVDDITAVLK
jgi:glycosyltransferase involved in cell wall biosynthesis